MLVIGITLYTLPNTYIWWLGFGLGAAIFLVVALSEFVVVDPNDARYPGATAILTALAFVIFLILAVVLKAVNARLVLVAPAPAADTGTLWAGLAGSPLRADRAGGQPGGGQSLPTGVPRANRHAAFVLGVGDLVPVDG